MIKIDNWAFIRMKIFFDEEEGCYKTKVQSLAEFFDYRVKHINGLKLNRVTGVINSGSTNEEVFTSKNGIDDYDYINGRVTTLSGETFYLGTINPYYSAFKNAVIFEVPIVSEVTLTRGLDGKYHLKGKLSNKKTHTNIGFTKIVGQSADKNLLYFADNSYAFVDWVNAEFDDKVKLDLIRKRLDFKEYVGLSIIPIFKF